MRHKRKKDDVTISMIQYKVFLRQERELKKYRIDGVVVAKMIHNELYMGMAESRPTHLILEPDKLNNAKEKFCYPAKVHVRGREMQCYVIKTKDNG